MKINNILILILPLTFACCVAQPPLSSGATGSPSLLEAAKAGNVETVKKLLHAGADPNQADKFDNTALLRAAEGGHLPVVKELLQAGADINKANLVGNTPLIMAAFNGYSAVVQELLRSGADIKKANQWGNTPLIMAAEKGHLAAVQELLRSGADIKKANLVGNTPLIVAAFNGYSAVVQELVQAGADINKANLQGQTAYDVADREIKRLIQEFPKKRAQITKMKPVVFQQIEVIGKTQQEVLDVVNKYEIAQAQKRSAKEILDLQQQIKIKSNNLRAALDQFKKLMAQVTMNITDADGNTPLHKAVQTNNLKLVELIFQLLPDLAKRKNNVGQTPVELAAGRPPILRLFIKAVQE